MPIVSDHWEFRACWKGLAAGQTYRLRVKAYGLTPPKGFITINHGGLNAKLVAKLADGKTLWPDGVILDDVGTLATRIRIVTSTNDVNLVIEFLASNNHVLGAPFELPLAASTDTRVALRTVAES